MRAKDIMTSTVHSVTPESSVLEAAALMVQKRLSAVVVTSGNAVVGIVSEANLLHRYELGTQRVPAARAWWRRLFDTDQAAWSYVQAHAMKIRDVMVAPVITVEEDTPAADIAALFDQHKIKQVPVVRAGSVVGVVSRADFVRALVARAQQEHAAQPQGDAAIRSALLAELESQSWWDSLRSNLSVSDGVVHFSGQVNSPEDLAPARVAAENIPGVRSVEDSRSVAVPAAGYPAGGYL